MTIFSSVTPTPMHFITFPPIKVDYIPLKADTFCHVKQDAITSTPYIQAHRKQWKWYSLKHIPFNFCCVLLCWTKETWGNIRYPEIKCIKHIHGVSPWLKNGQNTAEEKGTFSAAYDNWEGNVNKLILLLIINLKNKTKMLLIKKGGWVSRWAYFCIQPSSIFLVWCVVQYVYYILLYRTVCRKPYFQRYRQLELGEVTMYDKR